MPNFCAAPNCTRKSTQSDLAFFRFPRDPRRCSLWVENCRREDLEDKTPDQLNKHYRLCAKHFEPSMICKTSPYRTVLKDNAVPTVFDLTSHLNNPHSRHRKRIKVLSDEELRKMTARIENCGEQEQLKNDTQNEAQFEEIEEDHPPITPQEKEVKDYLKSLFDILVLMGKQNIPLNGHGEEGVEESGAFTPSNFQSLLESRITAGDEVLRRRFEMTAVNVEYCPVTQQRQMLEVCESCLREELLREVRESRFFSLVTDEAVEISGEDHLPVFLRFVDESNNLREEFAGFLPCEEDEDAVFVSLHTEITEKWGLNLEYCRGQSHVNSGDYALKLKAVASKLMEKYPLAVCTPCSTCALNIWLAKALPLAGVQMVLGTLKIISSFFSKSPQLLSELENAIATIHQANEERADELREICRTQWIERHDAFEVAVDLLEPLLLCMDSVNGNANFSRHVAFEAYSISVNLEEFEFVVTLVVLKNALSFTRAFGKNLQGNTLDVFFAASSLTAVLHSLNEVMENIEVYHEFWFEEATNLAAKMEIPVKLPRLYLRQHRPEPGFELLPESYYKESLSIPLVSRVIQELKEIFSETHLKALKCLSLVPSVMGQMKFNTSEESNADLYRNDLPNPDTLPAELHCWRIKWKHRGKDVDLPSTIYQTLQLSEVKFFPNVYSFLRVLCTLPVIKVESSKYDCGRKRLRAYLSDTPANHRSKSLALLNINYEVRHDLDLMVDTYSKMYPEKADEQ
ncbi:P52K kinase, partial [Polyodon spathula]|nr:P52K kinase [Polyodon spathula]